MSKPKIAILGSTSHIAKGLINNFLRSREFSLHLYTRSARNIHCFLASIGKSANEDCVIHESYTDLVKFPYDVLINCVGVGTLNKLRGNYSLYFKVTEEFDNLAIVYLCNNNPNALYLSFSSGAVYGKLDQPADENTVNHIMVNQIEPENYYAIARLNSEAKHRAFKTLNIVDLRIFSYFSRYIDLEEGYFITDVLTSILNGKTLFTNDENMVRDYLHPDDLFSMVVKCIDVHTLNAAFDVVSTCPVDKKAILEYFTSEYGLKYKSSKSKKRTSATGYKKVYCSNYQSATTVEFKPRFSSIETIRQETKHLIVDKLEQLGHETKRYFI